MLKLSKNMTQAMLKLADGKVKSRSSYQLQIGLNTLYALAARGLVKRSSGVGSFAFPQTAIKWSLTKEGWVWIHKFDEAS